MARRGDHMFCPLARQWTPLSETLEVRMGHDHSIRCTTKYVGRNLVRPLEKVLGKDVVMRLGWYQGDVFHAALLQQYLAQHPDKKESIQAALTDHRFLQGATKQVMEQITGLVFDEPSVPKKRELRPRPAAQVPSELNDFIERVTGTDPRTNRQKGALSGDLGKITCAWHKCEEPARPNSMYCSRNCSNRSARARHKQRKAEKKRLAS